MPVYPTSGFHMTAALLGCLLAFAPARAEGPLLRDLIDARVQEAWKQENIKPAGLADDATFLRRVYLDLVGTIPTYEEAHRFLEDKDPNKRRQLIDQLLDDHRFAEHQVDVWDELVFSREPAILVRERDPFRKWLTEQIARNEPYDRWVRALLLAEVPGTELFYVQYRNQPEDATVAVSRIFLGTQLQCARCHDHPFNRWTQLDFYGMAGFFVRLDIVERAGKTYTVGEKSSGEVLFTGSAKDQRPGKKGEPVKPRFLGGAELSEPPLPKDFKEVSQKGQPVQPFFSRKAKLAEWVTSADNRYFAEAIANRLWGQFLGCGLIHPVDDLNGRSKARMPALFGTLADEMAAHRFDLKWYIRELVNSETYQQAATGPVAATLPQWYERSRVRPLSAEELMAVLVTATGTQQKLDRRPFLQYFGEPSDGRGEFQGGLSEHLFLNNNRTLWALMQPSKGNLADRLLNAKDSWEARVDRLYLSVLSRFPRPEERQRFVAYLTADAEQASRVTEAIWVLVNSAEFRFNH